MRETALAGAHTASARAAAWREASARPTVASAPSTPQMDRLLTRKTSVRTQDPETDAQAASATQQLLSRRASRAAEADDNPFPHVAALPPKPRPPAAPGASASEEQGYTNRLLDAKRRAKDKDS